MNVPLPLPINIWSMQCMQEESPLEAVPLRALWQGNALTITNTSSSTLSGVKVFTQRGTSSSQAIAPGQSKQLTLPQGALKSYDPFFSMAFAANHPWVLRSGALERYLKAGACVVSAEVDNPAPPHGLVNRSAHATGTQSICVVVLAKPER
jgi:hypothetical protein